MLCDVLRLTNPTALAYSLLLYCHHPFCVLCVSSVFRQSISLTLYNKEQKKLLTLVSSFSLKRYTLSLLFHSQFLVRYHIFLCVTFSYILCISQYIRFRMSLLCWMAMCVSDFILRQSGMWERVKLVLLFLLYRYILLPAVYLFGGGGARSNFFLRTLKYFFLFVVSSKSVQKSHQCL